MYLYISMVQNHIFTYCVYSPIGGVMPYKNIHKTKCIDMVHVNKKLLGDVGPLEIGPH